MKPPTPRSLDEEIHQAHLDSRHEPALLQKLLTVTLYVHSPFGPRTGRLNLCMLDRPDGLRVIPVFTDLKKAKKAGRGKVLSVPVHGRELFEATRGATLMINPNDVSCTLYPEEIDGLLESGAVAHVAAFTVGEDEEVRIGAPTVPSDALASCLAQTLSGMHVAERAFLGEAHWRGRKPALAWFVAVVAPTHHGERISRAIASALDGLQPLDRALDVHVLDPAAALPDWIIEHALAPIYDRERPPSVRTNEGGHA
jgi:hypothetical protein